MVLPRSLLTEKKHGRNRDGSQELAKILGPKIFNNPKPQRLLRHLLEVADLKEDDIVLDFFSGSGSTAHAILDLNKEDLKCNFILIQLPESCDEKSGAFIEGYKTIADISKERIRRVIKRNFVANPNTTTGLKVGFKIYKQDTSTIFKWQEFVPDQDGTIPDLFNSLERAYNSPLQDGVTTQDFISEVILQEGFPLTSKQEEVVSGIFKITHKWVPFNLYATMLNSFKNTDLNKLQLKDTDHFVCLDKAFEGNDALKQELDNQCKNIHNIICQKNLNQHTPFLRIDIMD